MTDNLEDLQNRPRFTASDPNEPYIRLEAAAAKIDVKPATLVAWGKAYKDCPLIALPGSYRVRMSELLAWLEQFRRTESKKEEEAK
jgi:hypothetical protein